MKKLSLILLCLVATLAAVAKDVSVSGVVLSATDGEPLIGVSVQVKGQNNGVTTDIDGNFTIKVPENSVVTISYIGFKTK